MVMLFLVTLFCALLYFFTAQVQRLRRTLQHVGVMLGLHMESTNIEKQ